MLKVKSGDVEKLGLLFHRYSGRLFGYFYRMTGEASTSEDLVQNVFMRMLKYKHTYAEGGNFESWAFHIARNIHKDHLKKSKRYSWQGNMNAWESHLQDTDHQEARHLKEDELGNLENALRALSPEKRELLELTRFQKMKYEQVGRLLGISESAVKVRIHRTLKELKEHYLKLDA